MKNNIRISIITGLILFFLCAVTNSFCQDTSKKHTDTLRPKTLQTQSAPGSINTQPSTPQTNTQVQNGIQGVPSTPTSNPTPPVPPNSIQSGQQVTTPNGVKTIPTTGQPNPPHKK